MSRLAPPSRQLERAEATRVQARVEVAMAPASGTRVKILFGEHEVAPARTAADPGSTAIRRVAVLDSRYHDISRYPVNGDIRGTVDTHTLELALLPTVRAVERDLNAAPRAHRLRIAPPALSHREWNVLRLLAGPLGTAAIAAELGIETSTVKSHISSVCMKLGVASRSGARDLLVPGRLRSAPAVQAESLRIMIATDRCHGSGVVAGTLSRSFGRVAEIDPGAAPVPDRPDVLVIDARREPIKRTALRHWRRARPAALVAIVPDGLFSVRQAFGAGIDGVVRAGDIAGSLASTVEAVAAGQLVAPLGAFEPRKPKSPISNREDQVLRLANRGLTNDEIADELGLAPSTVKSHLSSSYRKLDVASRSEAGALLGYETRGSASE